MKKILIIIIFILTVQQSFSQENYYDLYNPFGVRVIQDLSMRFIFPRDAETNRGFFMYFDYGYGIGIDIIKNILSPGIFADVGIGADWFALFNQENNNEEKEYINFGFYSDVRVYNIINFFKIDIIPFFGYHFSLHFKPLPTAGLSIAFKNNLALEYAFYIPTSYEPYRRHHIAIKYSRNAYWDEFWSKNADDSFDVTW